MDNSLDSSALITPDMKQRAMLSAALPAPMMAMPTMSTAMPTLTSPVSLAGAPSQALHDTNRLQMLQNSGSGIDQMLHPVDSSTGIASPDHHSGFFAKLGVGALRAADIAGSVFAPNLAMAIPGTTLHHNMLVHQAMNTVVGDQQQAQSALDQSQKIAETNNLNLQPAYKQQAAELAQEKQNNTEMNQQAVLGQKTASTTAKNVTSLAQHGFAPDENDPTGKAIRPLRYEEMSEPQQAVHDLKSSQSDLADAQAALKQAQNDPSSPAYQLAKQRVNVAQQNASTAMGRLGLQGKMFEMRAHGTEGGVSLPGSMQDDQGHTIGTAFQQNVRPTGTERNKADMAASASEQLTDLKDIVMRNRTMFGPVYWQTTAFKQWIGAQSPDAQRFVAARTIAADHLAGTFGGRSEAALTALDNAVGQFKDNPDAAIAGIDQLTKANSRFQKAGTVRTTGSAAANPINAASSGATHTYNPTTGKIEAIK
jgi:hypothetical protein